MPRRGVPDRQASVSDLSPLESISGTSTAAEIGAAIQAYVAKVKG